MLRLTLRDITLIVLGVIIAEIIGPLIRPILSPTLEPLLPSIGEQTQWLFRYYTDAQLNKAIRYTSAGYGDSSLIISSQVAGFISLGIWSLICLFYHHKRKEVRSRLENVSLKTLLILGTIIFLGLGVYNLRESWIQSIGMHLNKQYQRTIMALSPYMSVQEEREINSMWALMKNSEDLEQIQVRLRSLWEKNGLTER